MVSLAGERIQVQQHDTARAFERLFQAEYPRVAAVAYRILNDQEEAEDVAQEVFWSFYQRHAPDAPYAAPWLYRAAAHTALNAVRGKQRRHRREEADALDRQRLQDAGQAALDPQRALEEAERRQEVRDALARLSARSATVLALRYSGLSYAEVAAALNVKIGQVGTLLRRAEVALRKEMNDATPR